jgi:hypothetical protein
MELPIYTIYIINTVSDETFMNDILFCTVPLTIIRIYKALKFVIYTTIMDPALVFLIAVLGPVFPWHEPP